MAMIFLTRCASNEARSDFSSRASLLAGSAVFDILARPHLLRAELRRATEGTAVIAAQLTGITLLAGVFFRKIEARLRIKNFSFNT